MVNTQPPPIKEAGYPMNLGHDNVGWVAAGGNIFRLVFEADSRETVVGSPAIGSNRCSRAHSRLDERNEALGGCVLDTRHADTTGAPTPDFGGNRDNRFLVCFPPRNANLPAAHIGFVDLDLAIQKLSARSNHGPAQLMEPCPSRLITAQAEYSLNPKRTDAVLLIRHIPHRLEPKPQRFPRTLEDRPRGRRRLTLASRTSLLAPGRHPRLGSPAGRTPKPGRPTDTPKKIRTGGLRSEPVVKFHKRARVIDPANGMGSILGHHNILPLRERIGYPILTIVVLAIIIANLNGACWAASRLIFDIGRQGWFPKRLALGTLRRAQPRPAIAMLGMLLCFVLLGYGLGFWSLGDLLRIAGQNFFILYTLSVVAFIRLSTSAGAKLFVVATLALCVGFAGVFTWGLAIAAAMFAAPYAVKTASERWRRRRRTTHRYSVVTGPVIAEPLVVVQGNTAIAPHRTIRDEKFRLSA